MIATLALKIFATAMLALALIGAALALYFHRQAGGDE